MFVKLTKLFISDVDSPTDQSLYFIAATKPQQKKHMDSKNRTFFIHLCWQNVFRIFWSISSLYRMSLPANPPAVKMISKSMTTCHSPEIMMVFQKPSQKTQACVETRSCTLLLCSLIFNLSSALLYTETKMSVFKKRTVYKNVRWEKWKFCFIFHTDNSFFVGAQ